MISLGRLADSDRIESQVRREALIMAVWRRTSSGRRWGVQDSIVLLRPVDAVRDAEQTAADAVLNHDTLTWISAAAVLGRVTEHHHVLVIEADHALTLDRIIGTDPDAASLAMREHNEYLMALDLAASSLGLTALYGLVYGWTVTVSATLRIDGDADSEIAPFRVDGSWAEAETAAEKVIEECAVLSGEVNVETCVGVASSLDV